LRAAQCGDAFKAEVSLFIPLLVIANSHSTSDFKPKLFACVKDGRGASLSLLAIPGCKGGFPDIPYVQFSKSKGEKKLPPYL